MTQPVLCIYRAGDEDTLLAAWAAHRALPDAEFVAAREGQPFRVEHGSPHTLWQNKASMCETCVKSLTSRDILILGDLYPLPALRAMAAEARSVLVLEQRGSARDLIVLPAPPRLQSWLNMMKLPHPALAAIVDPWRSICGIAWDYLHSQPCKLPARRKEAQTCVGGCGLYNRTPARPRIIDLIEDHAIGENHA